MPVYFADPLRGAETDTFAYQTVAVRMPAIGRRTLAEGRFTPEAAARLEALCADLPHGRIRLLNDPQAPDCAAWNAQITPYVGQTWLEAPWFFAETYFYRRLVEACGYFASGHGLEPASRLEPVTGLDPFRPQKELALVEARQALEAILPARQEQAHDLETLIRLALWGNQADLSMWPAGSANRPANGAGSRLLVDDAARAADYLRNTTPVRVSSKRGYFGCFLGGYATQKTPKNLLSRTDVNTDSRRVDLVLDNTGAELAFDLLLADGLLADSLLQTGRTVRLWVKLHPTFVSDAIAADIPETLSSLAASALPAVRGLAERLLGHLQAGRLETATHPYWTSSHMGWELPADLRQELAQAVLLVSKGDANYRRWLGDRHWAYDYPLANVIDYLPAPMLLLRVLKSEVLAGLQPGQAEAVGQQDARWMINGQWGLIQFTGG